MDIVFGVILLIAAVFLIVSVLMQSGKSHNLSGTIAGGAETFFGKSKGSTIDKMLSKITSVVAVVFCLIVVIMYVAQDDTDLQAILDAAAQSAVTDVAGDDTTAADGAETTAAEGEETTAAAE